MVGDPPGLWDAEVRLGDLSTEGKLATQGDPLEKRAATVDFAMFRPISRQRWDRATSPRAGGRTSSQR